MCVFESIPLTVCLVSSCRDTALHVNLCRWFFDSLDLEAKERVMEDMRLALMEQEETQSQMEEVLEERLQLIQKLSSGETQDLKL